MKNTFTALVLIAVLIIVGRNAWRYWEARQAEEIAVSATPAPTPTPTPVRTAVTPEPVKSANVTVVTPARDATVTLPFTVAGEARVFENNVAIVVRDPATGEALFEWFTTAASPDMGFFGPFSLRVTHLTRIPADHRLVVEAFQYSAKDGTPIDIAAVPVILGSQETRTIQVFFAKASPDSSMVTCREVFGVPRIVARDSAPASAAMELLLKGPTRAEHDAGYMTSLPGYVPLPRITIAQGTATVDFTKALQEGVGGSCRVTSIRAQIEKTLYQFPTVSGVIIQVDGNAEEALQP